MNSKQEKISNVYFFVQAFVKGLVFHCIKGFLKDGQMSKKIIKNKGY